MGIFNFWKKKTKKPDYEFSDDDRALAQQQRQDRAELARLEREIRRMDMQYQLEERKARLNDLKSELYGDDEEEGEGNSWENMLMPILAQYLSKGQGIPVQATSESPQGSTEAIHLTDEQLINLKSQIPKQYLSIAKTLDDTTLISYIRQKIGVLDEDTLNRALQLIRA